VTLFEKAQVVGTFLGFSESGLEFHADLILPYQNYFQSSPMHGQFVLVALESDAEAILGRITTISSQGRLISPAGEDYALRQQRENRPIPEDLRDQFLKYRVNIRILGVLRYRDGDKPPVFVPSHRRLPHVGAKVAFLSDELLRHVAGATADGEHAVELGFLALGEFVFAGQDSRAGDDERLQIRDPAVLPRFDILHLVSRRSFVFARAGFGKSNLVKLLFANLYGGAKGPVSEKRGGREVPVGTVIFDPDGEYYWPDDKGRPGLCDVPALQDRLVVFTDKEGSSEFYRSFAVDKVRLDIRELEPAKVISLVIPAERQEHQNIAKLKQLRAPEWSKLVDEVWLGRGGTDLEHFYQALQLDPRQQENEALAARSNMVRVVTALHDPSSQLLRALILALSDGKLCVVDISQMRGAQGLALAGVILQRIFEHNQGEFTKKDSRSVPVIAVVEEAQSVLGSSASHGEGPFISWVKEGRKYDLGAVLVTQQPGSIPAEILSQGDNWFIFHLLAEGDLRALQKANAHFSEDLLSSLLNEPLPGHGVFWSSVSETPYPIPTRALLFEKAFRPADPDYNRPRAGCYASRLKDQLDNALSAAVAVSGGSPVRANKTVDATETFKFAAIRQLAEDDRFQAQVRGDRGIKWGRIQHLLADHLPETFGQQHDERFGWVFRQGLVKRALDEILGEGGWRSDPRDGSQWVFATDRANPRSAVPLRPVDRSPDDDLGPPPDEPPF
jgi:Helicase HerA, central domain